jgi:hypothetical protein
MHRTALSLLGIWAAKPAKKRKRQIVGHRLRRCPQAQNFGHTLLIPSDDEQIPVLPAFDVATFYFCFSKGVDEPKRHKPRSLAGLLRPQFRVVCDGG